MHILLLQTDYQTKENTEKYEVQASNIEDVIAILDFYQNIGDRFALTTKKYIVSKHIQCIEI
jgi:hypothetical protein